MYYNDYDDYMRNILGYSNSNDNTYQGYSNNFDTMDYNMMYNPMNYNNSNYDNMMCGCSQMNQFQNRNSVTPVGQIEKMYPEIYNIINPMVCKMCDDNIQPISEKLIDQMTDDIYDKVANRIEVQNVININVETRGAEKVENRGEDSNSSSKSSNRSVPMSSSSMSSGNNVNVSASSKSTANNRNSSEKNNETGEMRSPSSFNQQQRRNPLLRDLIRILIINRLLNPNRPPFRPGHRPGPRPPMQGPGYGPRPPMPRMGEGEYIPYMY